MYILELTCISVLNDFVVCVCYFRCRMRMLIIPCNCLSVVSGWMLVARQRDGVPFLINEWRSESTDEKGDKYAIFDEMDSCRGDDGSYTFKLSWPLSTDITDIVWKQKSNPMRYRDGGVQGFNCTCTDCACPANFAGMEYNNEWALLQGALPYNMSQKYLNQTNESDESDETIESNETNETWFYRVGSFDTGEVRGPKGYRPNDVIEFKAMCVSPEEGERPLPKDESDVKVPKTGKYESAAPKSGFKSFNESFNESFNATNDEANNTHDGSKKREAVLMSGTELCTNGKWAVGLFAQYGKTTPESNASNASDSDDIIPIMNNGSRALDVDDDDIEVGWDPESCLRVLTRNESLKCSKDWFGIALNGHCYCVDEGDVCRDRTPTAQMYGLYFVVDSNNTNGTNVTDIEDDEYIMDTNDTVVVTSTPNITKRNHTHKGNATNATKANNTKTASNGASTNNAGASALARFVQKLSKILETRHLENRKLRGAREPLFGPLPPTESESAATARLRLKVMLDDLKHGRVPSVPLAPADENSPPDAMGAQSDVCRVNWRNSTALDSILITQGCGCQELLERARATGVVSLADISIPCQNSLEAFAWDQVMMHRRAHL